MCMVSLQVESTIDITPRAAVSGIGGSRLVLAIPR